MKSLIAKAKALHGGQGGFTLIEMMVVLGILAIIVGLVVPNMSGATRDAQVVQIQGQHEKMREAVFSYYLDTGQFPTEWSEEGTRTSDDYHQLWDDDGSPGWDGPYLEKPILQEDRWGGYWGVVEGLELENGEYYTVLAYMNVPREICRKLDKAMDDGTGSSDGKRDTGIAQYCKNIDVTSNKNWHDYVNSQGVGTENNNTLVIGIAREGS